MTDFTFMKSGFDNLENNNEETLKIFRCYGTF